MRVRQRTGKKRKDDLKMATRSGKCKKEVKLVKISEKDFDAINESADSAEIFNNWVDFWKVQIKSGSDFGGRIVIVQIQ